jgi:hypothetical protein
MKSVKRREPVIAPTSLWPLEIQRLFLSLSEIPWASLTALSTVLGGSLLFVYFRSIGVQLTGLTELVGLGITTALVSLAMLICFAVVLFAPTLLYKQVLLEADSSFKSVNRRQVSLALAGLQSGALGCVLLNFAHTRFVCNGQYVGWLTAGLLLFSWGLYSLIRTVLVPTGFGKRVWTAFCSFLVAGCGVFPIVVIFPLQHALIANGWAADVVFFGLFFVAVFLNAIVAPALLGRSAIVFALCVATYLLLALPMLGANPVFFPTLVARAVGVRGAEPQELRISNKACEALVAQISHSPTPNLQCTVGDWSSMNALILSNVGDRWLVQIPSLEVSSATGKIEQLEVTIPREDIQVSIIRRSPTSGSKVENVCKN